MTTAEECDRLYSTLAPRVERALAEHDPSALERAIRQAEKQDPDTARRLVLRAALRANSHGGPVAATVQQALSALVARRE